MKKIFYICTALIAALSTALTLTSCGNEPIEEEIPTTIKAAENTESETLENSDSDVVAEEWYDEQFNASFEEITTNQSQQADFDSITLPPAEGETKENTVDSTEPTRPNQEPTATTKADEQTTKTEITTANSNSGGLSGSPESTTLAVVDRPNATYFDKYVKNVLASNSYTATVKGNFQGYGATINMYKNGSSTGYQISSSYHSVPVSCRYFYSSGYVYIIVPSMRSYSAVDIADPIVGTLESMMASESVAMTADGMDYCGVKSEGGYIVESYKASNGTVYHYYFNNSGLSKIVEANSSGTSTISIKLTSGVSESGVFSVPSGYAKVDVEVLMNKLESL